MFIDDKSRTITMKKIKGFSLIELLIAAAVFSTIGVITLSILFVTLRLSKKADLLIVLKQNGNAALSQVVKSVRYAKSLNDPVSCTSPIPQESITITSYLDGEQTTFRCVNGPSATVASNGASLLDTNVVKVSSCSFTCSQQNLNDPPTINFKFNLRFKNESNLAETRGELPFQTSVLMRNYNR